jgi:hypothetical protein
MLKTVFSAYRGKTDLLKISLPLTLININQVGIKH